MTLEERAFRKATRRLIPFLFLIYVVAYLDRVNVSFAQLQLEDDLGFSDTIFGIGAGIFSLGYVIFGVPSNLALARFGARRWLAAIMIVWGVISASMMFIEGATSFYVLRFLLGAAEAGFFPGIILFLTWWFPERERTRALALFLTAVSAAYVAGGPLSGGLLELDGVAGLDGWQWLFLRRGPARDALGFVTLRYLDERPQDADWLEPDERDFLTAEVERERELREALGSQRSRDALGERPSVAARARVLRPARGGLRAHVLRPRPRPGPDRLQRLRGGCAVGHPVSGSPRSRWSWRPAAAAAWPRPMLVGAAGTLLTAYAQSPLLLTFGDHARGRRAPLRAAALLGAPTALLSGSAAAAGIALVAAVGNLGGFVGPAFTGIAEDSTRRFEMPLTVLAGLLARSQRDVPVLSLGVSTRFVCSVSSARISFGRVSCGMITSSM